MAWTFNDIRFFVQKIEGNKARIIARLQPITGGTHLHHFGFEDTIVTISGIVVGNTDLNALLALFEISGTSYALKEDTTTRGTYYPKSISYTRLPTVYQTLRTDLSCEAAVYSVEMELYVV